MNYLIEGHGRDYQLVPVVATKRRPFMAITIAQWKEKDLRALRIAKILRVRPGDIFFCLDFSSHLLPLHRIQIQRIKLEKVLFKVLVYDLLPIIYPQFFTMRNTRNYEAWFDTLTMSCAFQKRSRKISEIMPYSGEACRARCLSTLSQWGGISRVADHRRVCPRYRI
jgi:hypothetical protein